VADRLPKNLAVLYEAFSRQAIDGIFSGETYQIDDVEFVCRYAPESTSNRFFIVKPPDFVEYFMDFCRRFEGGRIFELGIAEGGSTAMVALTASPRKLVAVDLEPEPLAALAEFAEQRGLQDVVRPYYGVDQADRERLRAIVDDEFGGEPIDWVLDDASHQLEPTRASFEALFPRLRPGGLYTIEDWTADIRFRDAVRDALRNPTAGGEPSGQRPLSEGVPDHPATPKPPLSTLAVELVLACAAANDAVVEVTTNEHWVIVERGPAPLDPDRFQLTDLYVDYFGYLPSAP
jgi:predicted O-methyltransferase YrrM